MTAEITPILPNLRLTIDIDRPTPDNPDGYISLTAEERGTKRREDGADGPCNEQTLKRVLLDVHSYYECGHKSRWADMIRRDQRGQER